MAIVTFETLREVQRKEKKSENLAELTDEFYSGAKEYFERAAKSDINEVRNARSVLEDIVDRREKKILNQAMRAVRLRERPDLGGMTSREKDFFNKLLENIKNFRESTDLNGSQIELKEAKKSRAEDIEEIIEHEKEISEHPIKTRPILNKK